MTSPGRMLVLVSGAPGSGKTRLAGPLAAELGTTAAVDITALAGLVRTRLRAPAEPV
jgi:predicted kinase